MKRNMDRIRQILLKMQEHEHEYDRGQLIVQRFSEEEVGYHHHR